VIKPTLDSSSGTGVRFFKKSDNGQMYDEESGELLTKDLLDTSYPEKNFIVQETFKQSAFMSQFNPTSVNTLRIQVYRSVKDNQIHVPNIVMRIGGKGALVDNAHAGGAFIGIMQSGKLQNFVCNQYGQKSNTFNDLDFSKNEFVLPNFEEIVSFAKKVGQRIHHARLVALDVVLDESNNPKLLEYNIGGFSLWLFQFTTGTAFGEWTDEIIEYVKEHKNEASRVHVEF
jgi:hypothetical protein